MTLPDISLIQLLDKGAVAGSGFILLVPADVFAGGVHGSHVEIVFRLVPLANGLAYALWRWSLGEYSGFARRRKRVRRPDRLTLRFGKSRYLPVE